MQQYSLVRNINIRLSLRFLERRHKFRQLVHAKVYVHFPMGEMLVKKISALLVSSFLSASVSGGIITDHWAPGEELGPPTCDNSSGGNQGHVGNPIHAGLGNKFERIPVYVGIGTNPLKFVWNYNSELLGSEAWGYNLQSTLNPVEVNPNEFEFKYSAGHGGFDRIQFDTLVPSDSACVAGSTSNVYEQITPDDRYKVSATTIVGTSCEVLDTATYFNPNGNEEHFAYSSAVNWNNGNATMSHVDFPNGERHTYQYDVLADQLTVQHSNGQSMTVDFVQLPAENGTIISVPSTLTVDTLVWTFDYDEFVIGANSSAQSLKKINGPAGTSQEFTYSTAVISANLPTPVMKVMLTGRYINGQHAAGWVYDGDYLAYRSYHGPNPASMYQGTSFFDNTQYGAIELNMQQNPNNYVGVTNEFGLETTYHYNVMSGYQGQKKSKLDNIVGPASTNCLTTSRSRTYDQHWRVIETVDPSYRTHKTTYTNDTNSRSRVKRLINAHGTGATQRTTNYEYASEDKNLVSKVISDKLTTEYDYYSNGRIQEVRYIDNTTHSNPYSTSGTIQRTSYTYEYHDLDERQIKKITADGPRTDVTDISVSNFDVQGRLTSVVNALGHTTTFSSFNEWQLPENIVRNNILVTLDYQAGATAPLLTHVQVGIQSPQVTQYNAFDLPEKITYPSGGFIEYFYKTMDAGSLYLVRNSAGEELRIDRTVDVSLQVENFVEEFHEDSVSTVPMATISSVYDALGRLYEAYNALGDHTQQAYDEADRLISTVRTGLDGDGAAVTAYDSFDYDARNRVNSHYDEYRSTTFEYNGLDAPKKVTDALYRATTMVTDAFGNDIQIVSKDTGKTKYWFDLANNLIKIQDAESEVKEYEYDALNRRVWAKYPANPSENVQFIYDGNAPGQNGDGKLTQIIGPSGTTTYYYDVNGSLARKSWTFNGQTYDTYYVFNNGQLQSMTYPSGRVISYLYDTAGRILQIGWADGSNLGTIVSNVDYNPMGPVAGFDFGNGVTHSLSYDSEYRLSAIQSGSVLNLDYNYDSFERITEIADLITPANDQSLRYSTFDELNSAVGPYGTFSYNYGDIKNRSDITRDGINHAYELLNSGRLNRVYDYTNWALVAKFRYRKNGDVRKIANTTINMNYSDHVASVVSGGVTTQYKYAHNRLRTHKSTGDVAYHYDEAGQLITETNASTGAVLREYYYMGNQIVGTTDTAGAATSADLQYVHLNHMATPLKVTDDQQQVIWAATYSPFGEASVSVQNITFNIRLPGQYYDAESGFHYNWNRYYAPEHGQYLQSDPTGLADGPNSYGYVHGNPLKYYDPNGEAAHIAIGAGIGAFINGGIYAYNTDNFTWSGLAREAAIGAVVGGVTAAVPGAIATGSLNFGGRVSNALASFGTAAAAGAAGSVASQASQCGSIDYGEALIAGGANAAGLGIGRALQGPARNFSTTNIPARPGIPFTSPTGRQFDLFSRPARQDTNEVMQQLIQDVGGAITSTAISESR